VSARFKTKLHTLDGTWQALGGTAAGAIWAVLDDDMDIGAVGMRAHWANTGKVYWADSDGSEGGYLGATETAGLQLDHKFVYVRDFFLKGTSGDKVFLTWLAP
jgi:hypothetical protein